MNLKIASLLSIACLVCTSGTALANGRWGFIEGAWRVDVTTTDCKTGEPVAPPTFPTLNTYHVGGTLSEHGSGLPPSRRGSGHGIWKRTGTNTFTYRLTFQVFDPSGQFLALTQNVTSNLEVTGNTFTGTSTFTRTDVSGNISVPSCAKLAGTRLVF